MAAAENGGSVRFWKIRRRNQQNPWFVRFAIALLEGSKPVLALIERDPFGGKPPAQIRANIYEYHFTTFDEKRRTGGWWKREPSGEYLPPISLRK